MNVLTAHIGHRLVAKDDRTLRCHDCIHTLLLGAAQVAPTSTSTAPRLDERCPIHLGGWAGACSGCAADAKATDDGLPRDHQPVSDPTLGAAAVRAVLEARKAAKQ